MLKFLFGQLFCGYWGLPGLIGEVPSSPQEDEASGVPAVIATVDQMQSMEVDDVAPALPVCVGTPIADGPAPSLASSTRHERARRCGADLISSLNRLWPRILVTVQRSPALREAPEGEGVVSVRLGERHRALRHH